jgi:hypothetical protein
MMMLLDMGNMERRAVSTIEIHVVDDGQQYQQVIDRSFASQASLQTYS